MHFVFIVQTTQRVCTWSLDTMPTAAFSGAGRRTCCCCLCATGSGNLRFRFFPDTTRGFKKSSKHRYRTQVLLGEVSSYLPSARSVSLESIVHSPCAVPYVWQNTGNLAMLSVVGVTWAKNTNQVQKYNQNSGFCAIFLGLLFAAEL